MTLFLSTFENKIDEKGRVSVPSSFRNAVKDESFQGVILYRSFTAKCIEGCTISRMQELSDATDNLDIFSKQQEDLTALLFANAKELPFDVAGRIIIPTEILKDVGIKGNAMFVGRGKTFQIWNKNEFEKAQKSSIEKSKKIRPSLQLKKDAK
ncbi:MAG: division/cell wall cluster transcriptional repressor MraZ [Rickettsiales bacterium]|jgi:MraZ protein|nr:division/cell wall cluster transcriptional repressor MraZ [Rickettsiales bacterium]